MEFPGRRGWVCLEEVFSGLLDEQLPQSIPIVRVIKGPSQRLPFRWQCLHVRVFHDELARLIHPKTLSVHPERDDEPAVPQQRFFQLDQPQRVVPVTFIKHHLFAVVRPALAERIVPVRLPSHRLPKLSLKHPVSKVARKHLVDRDILQSHIVQVTQPLFPGLWIPRVLRRRNVVESFQALLLEWAPATTSPRWLLPAYASESELP